MVDLCPVVKWWSENQTLYLIAAWLNYFINIMKGLKLAPMLPFMLSPSLLSIAQNNGRMVLSRSLKYQYKLGKINT